MIDSNLLPKKKSCVTPTRYTHPKRTHTPKKMCWSATTSFVSLCAGTLLNASSYLFLSHVESPTASMVLAWQYALLMQIPEGVVWVRIGQGKSISFWSRVGMLLNVTQPAALLAGVRLGGLYNGFRYAHVALLLYSLLLLTEVEDVWSLSSSIAPEEGCPHLDLRYWDTSRGVLYVTTSLLVVSEARPVYWAVVNASLFVGTLLLAAVVYQCGVGSVWCWFVVWVGPLLVVSDWVGKRSGLLLPLPSSPPPPSSSSGGGGGGGHGGGERVARMARMVRASGDGRNEAMERWNRRGMRV
jgi:hypothetical protein